MLTTHRLIGLTLATLLVLGAPSALASGNGKDKDQTAEGEDCPGNSGNGYGNGKKCDAPQEEASSEGSSESGESTEERDEHPQGRNDEQATPSPSPSPSPTPTPTPGNGQGPGNDTPGSLDVQVEVDQFVAQVGTKLTYNIHVTNTGSEPVSAIVYNEIPDEVDLLGATLPRATSRSAPFGWSLENLAPGSLTTLTWTGQVSRVGDLEATNVVTVESEDLDAAPVETNTYLAAVKGLKVQRSATEPDWGTHTEREVVFRAADPDSVEDAAAAAAPSAQLPVTGFPVLEMSWIAALLLLGGLVLTSKGKRVAAVALMVVLVAAACTSDSPPPVDRPGAEADARDGAEEEEEGDQVLGERVTRDDEASEETGSEDAGDSTGVPGVPEDGDDEAAEGDAVALEDDADVEEALVRDVVVVEVENAAPEPQRVESTSGFNTVSFQWDEPSRSVLTAASSVLIRPGSPIDLLSSLSDDGQGIHSRVTLTNISEAERLSVQGHLVLVVTSADGSVARLSSPLLDQILDPKDDVFADFVLALPTGSYTVQSSFVAS